MEKVILKRIDSYDVKEIKKVVLSSMQDLGGVDKFIKRGMKIALKPNLLLKKGKEIGATTNPAVVEAIGQIIIEADATPIVIESPGGPFTKSRLKGVYEGTGMSEVCDRSGISLNYEVETSVIGNPEAMFLKTVTIIKALQNVDAIINLPKLKTHGQMVYTGAIKNMFGIVPGIIKAEHHFRTPNYADFANAIIDIYLSKKPMLNIMDAIEAMEGNGPSAGDIRKLDSIIISEDAFSLDFFACRLINLKYEDVPILRQAVNRGYLIPEIDAANKEIIQKYICKDFKIPSRDNPKVIDFSDHTPSGKLIGLLKPKPVFDHDRCVLCGECIRSCPAEVLSVKNKKISIKLDGCIRCYCCQELCPENAVRIKRGFIIGAALCIDKLLKGEKK